MDFSKKTLVELREIAKEKGLSSSVGAKLHAF